MSQFSDFDAGYDGFHNSFMKLFHNKRHPKDMGQKEIEAFLTYLAVDRKVAASTQNQAFCALLFLYDRALKNDIFDHINALRVKTPERLSTVLSHREVISLIEATSGVYKIIAKIFYGSGLRGIECLRLRVKDIDFERYQIIVRNGKGLKDRVTMLPQNVSTTMIYTHVMSRGAMAVRSPLDMPRSGDGLVGQ